MATQLTASDRVYPRDLHAILEGRWDSSSLFDGFPSVELPPKAVLDELLDVCFQASMLTEEGRPTVFRVAYIASAAPVTPNRAQLPPVTRYNLSASVPFTEAELRRLAPVADPRRVLIAVEQAGERLQIYGLIDIGMALWQMARHERIMGHSSPEALIVASRHPGELSVSRGDRPVLRLRGGRIVTPREEKGDVANILGGKSTCLKVFVMSPFFGYTPFPGLTRNRVLQYTKRIGR